MKFGKSVYLGNKQPKKIMLGSTLVWPLSTIVTNNIIYYTTAGNVKYTGLPTTGWGNNVNIINHTYAPSNGRGAIEFDNDVTVIQANAFNWNYNGSNSQILTSINIPSSVTAIGDSAFQSSGFESIVIPENVTSIGERAFLHCENLTKMYFKSAVPPVVRQNSLMFSLVPEAYYSSLTIYVPIGSGDLYRAREYFYSNKYGIVEYDYDANPV